MSDFDMEDDDEDEESDDEDGPIDIRSLVQGKSKAKDAAEPPKKKQKN